MDDLNKYAVLRVLLSKWSGGLIDYYDLRYLERLGVWSLSDLENRVLELCCKVMGALRRVAGDSSVNIPDEGLVMAGILYYPNYSFFKISSDDGRSVRIRVKNVDAIVDFESQVRARVRAIVDNPIDEDEYLMKYI